MMLTFSTVTPCMPMPVSPCPTVVRTSNDSIEHEPGPYDVVCGRGKAAWDHSGNHFLRQLVEKQVASYSSVSSKVQRSTIISAIVDKVRSRGNGFLRKEADGTWVEVGDATAREKVGQQIRDALGLKYRSSNASKQQRRAATSSKFHQALHNIMVSNTAVKETTNKMAVDSKQSAHLSDDATLAMFSANNKFLLESVIKTDKKLVNKFQCAMKSPMIN